MLIANATHTPFYIAAGALAAWAVVVGLLGIKSANFPSNVGGFRIIAGVTALLFLATVTMAITTAERPENPNQRPEIVLGVVPQPQADAQGDAGADAMGTPDAAAPKAGPVALAADPSGQLAYIPKDISAKAGEVSIVFTNASPLPHNVVVKDASGKKLAETPVFSGGKKPLMIKLAAGSYPFYCSVPGHEAAGMVGKLTVS